MMDKLVNFGIWIYTYCLDFCVNMSYLLGIDYVTFGSLFFGFFMNGVIVLLIILNIWISVKNKNLNKN